MTFTTTNVNNVNPSERMRITSAGDVGIGTTSPASNLHVVGSARVVVNSGAVGDTLFGAINGVSNGYRIQSDSNNNITYSWNTGATSSNISNITAGTYSVIATDANGCQISASITLTQPEGMNQDLIVSSFSGGANVSCVGAQDGSITAVVTGGQPNYTYQWNTGATSSTASGLGQGEYSVIISDALGCSIQASYTITEPEPFSVSAIVTTDYNGLDISCYNANDGGAMAEVINGVAPLQFIWFDAYNQIIANSQSISNLGPGQYTVLVTDQNGCQSTASVTLTQPEPLFIELTTLTDFFGLPVSCENNADGSIGVSFNGGNPVYTIEWQQLPQFHNDQIISGLSVGNYSVVLFDLNGCQISDEVILDAHPLPNPLSIEPQQVCLGEQIEISCGSTPHTVTWEFSNGINASGCQVSFPSTSVGCINASITLTSQFGCVTTQTLNNIVCVDPLPYAAFNYSPNTNISFISANVYFMNQSENAESYFWTFGDGTGGSDHINPQHTFPDSGPGQYLVTLYAYSEFGCLDTATQTVFVEDELIFYVPNAFTPDGDDYNNVFSPVFSSGYDPYNYTLYIFNRWGEVLFESHDTNVGWNGTYGGNMMQDGVYIWKIEIKDSDKGRTSMHQGTVTLLR
jgi:gliding motility-associated-like protein